MEKQFKMLKTILAFHHISMDALKKGASMNEVFNLPVREAIARMRYLEEKDIGKIDDIEGQIKNEVAGVTPVGGESDAA
jgi:V/A-type H+-transporting ATPase subunit A